MKPLFIASLAHSGSTALELWINSNLHFVGVGELFNVYRNRTSINRLNDNFDFFWKPIFDSIPDLTCLSQEEFYKIVFHNLESLSFSSDIHYWIDSSKSLSSLESISYLPKTIFLVRDVRGWVSSMQRANKKRFSRSSSVSNFLKQVILSNTFVLFLRWYFVNKAFLAYLSTHEYDYIVLTYEDLCTNTCLVADRLSNFLGVELNPFQSFDLSRSYNINGNRMRHDAQGGHISYDKTWFYSYKINLAYLLLPFISSMNRSLSFSGKNI